MQPRSLPCTPMRSKNHSRRGLRRLRKPHAQREGALYLGDADHRIYKYDPSHRDVENSGNAPTLDYRNIRELKSIGYRAYESGDNDGAVAALSKVVAINSRDAHDGMVWRVLARAHVGLWRIDDKDASEHLKKARESFIQCFKYKENERSPHLLLEFGLVYVNLHKHNAALELFKSIHQTFPRFSRTTLAGASSLITCVELAFHPDIYDFTFAESCLDCLLSECASIPPPFSQPVLQMIYARTLENIGNSECRSRGRDLYQDIYNMQTGTGDFNQQKQWETDMQSRKFHSWLQSQETWTSKAKWFASHGYHAIAANFFLAASTLDSLGMDSKSTEAQILFALAVEYDKVHAVGLAVQCGGQALLKDPYHLQCRALLRKISVPWRKRLNSDDFAAAKLQRWLRGVAVRFRLHNTKALRRQSAIKIQRVARAAIVQWTLLREYEHVQKITQKRTASRRASIKFNENVTIVGLVADLTSHDRLNRLKALTFRASQKLARRAFGGLKANANAATTLRKRVQRYRRDLVVFSAACFRQNELQSTCFHAWHQFAILMRRKRAVVMALPSSRKCTHLKEGPLERPGTAPDKLVSSPIRSDRNPASFNVQNKELSDKMAFKIAKSRNRPVMSGRQSPQLPRPPIPFAIANRNAVARKILSKAPVRNIKPDTSIAKTSVIRARQDLLGFSNKDLGLSKPNVTLRPATSATATSGPLLFRTDRPTARDLMHARPRTIGGGVLAAQDFGAHQKLLGGFTGPNNINASNNGEVSLWQKCTVMPEAGNLSLTVACFLTVTGRHIKSFDGRGWPMNDRGVALTTAINPAITDINLADSVLLTSMGLRHLKKLPRLKILDLTRSRDIDFACLQVLAQAAESLQVLTLEYCSHAVTDFGITCIASKCRRLRELYLKGNGGAVTDDSLHALAKYCINNLALLDVSGCAITNAGLSKLVESCGALHILRVRHCGNVSGRFMYGKKASRISELDLYRCNQVKSSCISRIVTVTSPYIRSLNLQHCSQLTDGAIFTIAKECSNLLHLHIGHATSLTDMAFTTISKNLCRLELLDLTAMRRITSRVFYNFGGRSVGPLYDNSHVLANVGLPYLKSLNMAENRTVNDAAIKVIARHCTLLESISMRACEQISDAGILSISENCSRLKHFDVRHIRQISDRSITQLARHCRSLTSIKIELFPISRPQVLLANQYVPTMYKDHEIASAWGDDQESVEEAAIGVGSRRKISMCQYEQSQPSDASLCELFSNCPLLEMVTMRFCLRLTGLARTIQMSKLYSCDFTGCISMKRTKLIKLVGGAPNLRRLYLGGCRLLSQNFILQNLMRHCRYCQLSGGNGNTLGIEPVSKRYEVQDQFLILKRGYALKATKIQQAWRNWWSWNLCSDIVADILFKSQHKASIRAFAIKIVGEGKRRVLCAFHHYVLERMRERERLIREMQKRLARRLLTRIIYALQEFAEKSIRVRALMRRMMGARKERCYFGWRSYVREFVFCRKYASAITIQCAHRAMLSRRIMHLRLQKVLWSERNTASIQIQRWLRGSEVRCKIWLLQMCRAYDLTTGATISKEKARVNIVPLKDFLGGIHILQEYEKRLRMGLRLPKSVRKAARRFAAMIRDAIKKEFKAVQEKLHILRSTHYACAQEVNRIWDQMTQMDPRPGGVSPGEVSAWLLQTSSSTHVLYRKTQGLRWLCSRLEDQLSKYDYYRSHDRLTLNVLTYEDNSGKVVLPPKAAISYADEDEDDDDSEYAYREVTVTKDIPQPPPPETLEYMQQAVEEIREQSLRMETLVSKIHIHGDALRLFLELQGRYSRFSCFAFSLYLPHLFEEKRHAVMKFIEHNAAVLIQKYVRGMIAREYVYELKESESWRVKSEMWTTVLYESARSIQRMFRAKRGWAAVSRRERIRLAKLKKQRLLDDAATKIQAMFRGWRARAGEDKTFLCVICNKMHTRFIKYDKLKTQWTRASEQQQNPLDTFYSTQ